MVAAASTERTNTVRVVRAASEHASAVSTFVRTMWGGSAVSLPSDDSTGPSVAEASPSFVFLNGQRVLGYVGTIPVRVWDGRSERPAHWLKGLMVVPESRNGPVGYLVLKEAVRQLGTAMALVVQADARRLYTALGFTDHGTLEERLLVLRPERVLEVLHDAGAELASLTTVRSWMLRSATHVAVRPIAAGFASALLAGMSARASLGGWGCAHRLDIEEHVSPAELEELWMRVRETMPATPSRTGTYLRQRYCRAHDRYLFATVRNITGALRALAIVKSPRADGDARLRGLRVASISEVLFPLDEPQAGVSAIVCANRAAWALEADAVNCASTHPLLRKLLKKCGFISVSSRVHFLSRSEPGEAPLTPNIADWWLTRGDSYADEVF